METPTPDKSYLKNSLKRDENLANTDENSQSFIKNNQKGCSIFDPNSVFNPKRSSILPRFHESSCPVPEKVPPETIKEDNDPKNDIQAQKRYESVQLAQVVVSYPIPRDCKSILSEIPGILKTDFIKEITINKEIVKQKESKGSIDILKSPKKNTFFVAIEKLLNLASTKSNKVYQNNTNKPIKELKGLSFAVSNVINPITGSSKPNVKSNKSPNNNNNLVEALQKIGKTQDFQNLKIINQQSNDDVPRELQSPELSPIKKNKEIRVEIQKDIDFTSTLEDPMKCFEKVRPSKTTNKILDKFRKIRKYCSNKGHESSSKNFMKNKNFSVKSKTYANIRMPNSLSSIQDPISSDKISNTEVKRVVCKTAKTLHEQNESMSSSPCSPYSPFLNDKGLGHNTKGASFKVQSMANIYDWGAVSEESSVTSSSKKSRTKNSGKYDNKLLENDLKFKNAQKQIPHEPFHEEVQYDSFAFFRAAITPPSIINTGKKLPVSSSKSSMNFHLVHKYSQVVPTITTKLYSEKKLNMTQGIFPKVLTSQKNMLDKTRTIDNMVNVRKSLMKSDRTGLDAISSFNSTINSTQPLKVGKLVRSNIKSSLRERLSVENKRESLFRLQIITKESKKLISELS